MLLAEANGNPITLSTPSFVSEVAFYNIAKRLLGEDIPMQKFVPKKASRIFFK